jgi:hypothetical protein
MRAAAKQIANLFWNILRAKKLRYSFAASRTLLFHANDPLAIDR